MDPDIATVYKVLSNGDGLVLYCQLRIGCVDVAAMPPNWFYITMLMVRPLFYRDTFTEAQSVTDFVNTTVNNTVFTAVTFDKIYSTSRTIPER